MIGIWYVYDSICISQQLYLYNDNRNMTNKNNSSRENQAGPQQLARS